jgi:shikimate kinase
MEKSILALIGPSGSGKSSIGKRLSGILNWDFLDTDREIERISGKTVAQIFELDGEEDFRRKESELLDELASSGRKNLVLSTGGGFPIFGNNWERLEDLATIVYLTAPLEVLVTRVNTGEHRPLLSGSAEHGQKDSSEQTRAKLGKLITERESIYNRARYRIDTSSASAVHLSFDIIRLTGLVIPPAR